MHAHHNMGYSQCHPGTPKERIRYLGMSVMGILASIYCILVEAFEVIDIIWKGLVLILSIAIDIALAPLTLGIYILTGWTLYQYLKKILIYNER